MFSASLNFGTAPEILALQNSRTVLCHRETCMAYRPPDPLEKTQGLGLTSISHSPSEPSPSLGFCKYS